MTELTLNEARARALENLACAVLLGVSDDWGWCTPYRERSARLILHWSAKIRGSVKPGRARRLLAQSLADEMGELVP